MGWIEKMWKYIVTKKNGEIKGEAMSWIEKKNSKKIVAKKMVK